MQVKSVLAVALLGVTPAAAQISRTTFGGLPRWADSALIAAGLGRQFTLSSQLNPAYEFGDFDGDGFFDVAVEIKDTGGLPHGVARGQCTHPPGPRVRAGPARGDWAGGASPNPPAGSGRP